MQHFETGRIHIITGDNGTGKTRFLSKTADSTQKKLKNKTSEFSRLICLSGTVFEKFPKPDKSALANIKNNYYYFGYKTNNNMFSDITPFRNIVSILINNKISSNSMISASKSMIDIGFSPKFKAEFRWARGSKIEENIPSITFNLNNITEGINKISAIKEKLNNGEIHLNKVIFEKLTDKSLYLVQDLSSGERQFLLIILALCFSIEEKALILFDEPENSMHPSWQLKISKTINKIIEDFKKETTSVIATHSPLVVSSIPNIKNRILDFGSTNDRWQQQEMSGSSINIILKEQFKLHSSRSIDVLSVFQRCLHNLAINSPEFCTSREELKQYNLNLNEDDPLYDAYKTIMEYK